MASFGEFLLTFHDDMNRRGKQFERFIKWFLKNDPEWATQVQDVWLWDEYPRRWGPDCGIDLVFKSKSGKTWAVQAKCYSSDHDIAKSDVDKFLSESNRKQIDHRLLIATTDRIGANARQVLDAQEKSVVRYLLAQFESAAVEFPDSIQSLSTGKRKPPPELDRPHQIEAVDAVMSGFQTASRGQLIMACGTGKTFVCLWVKERLKAKRTLVLVPSLNLLSQMLNEWTFAAREPFDALCVCSDFEGGGGPSFSRRPECSSPCRLPRAAKAWSRPSGLPRPPLTRPWPCRGPSMSPWGGHRSGRFPMIGNRQRHDNVAILLPDQFRGE
jgi:predicted helicase